MHQHDVTKLLHRWRAGEPEVLREIVSLLYEPLRSLAHQRLRHAPLEDSLNTTGLVHEAYLRLAQPAGRSLHGHHHFFALAAKAMRHIVIDRARARLADKRGGACVHIGGIDDAADVVDGAEMEPDQLLRLDRALTELAADEPRLAELVELRFFAGMPVADIAVLQGLSERTLNREWRRARAQLHASLYPDG